MNNRRVAYPPGKCLGGSSAINLMALIFPSRACLDGWKDIGNPGWGWDEMQKYYRKFQRHCQPADDVAKALGMEVYNNDSMTMDGPIMSSHPKAADVAQTAWVDTWKHLRKQLNGDPLSGDSIGGYTSAASVDPLKGERMHSGVGYYAPVAQRKNLHVVTGAMIDKVELDASNQDNVVATGVVFTYEGKTYTVKARKEVILSAGTLASPAILERSGIGSKALCAQLGIQNIIDSPGVGENFQDHLTSAVSYEVNDNVPTADVMRDPCVIQQVMEQYQTSKSGPLANGGGHSFAYTPLSNFDDPPFSQDDMQTLLDKHLPCSNTKVDSFKTRHESFVRSILSRPSEASSSLCLISVQCDTRRAETPKEVFGINKPENYISMLPQLAHPLSRGSVHITSTDPDVYPEIKPNFLAHPLDAEIMGRHMMQVETIARTPPLSGLLKPNGMRIPEGSDAHTLESAIELVKAGGMSNYHPAGTCAMVPKDLGGVIDSRMKVYATRNLRVCDASLFPLMVRGNIQSTVYACAEKGSDVLKEDLGFL